MKNPMNPIPPRRREGGLEGDWNGTLRGKGTRPPKSPPIVIPVRLHFTDEEVEQMMRDAGQI
jgi:hypothetical protein